MSADRRRRKQHASLVLPVLVLLLSLGVVAAGVLLMTKGDSSVISMLTAEPAETTAHTEPPEQPTELQTEPVLRQVVTAGGDASKVTFAASYTVDAGQAEEAAGRVVARSGSAKLTNAELQILYMQQIADRKAGGSTVQPDYSRALDCQLCPLGDGTLSWQHYFLEKAVKSWALTEAAVQAADEPILITEEAFKPDVPTEGLHAEYIAEDLPVNDFLYGDRDCYTPNKLHQAWLDALPDTLAEAAAELGYSDPADYAQSVYGAGVTEEDITQTARDTNLAYMYLTEMSYDLETEETIVNTVPADGTADIRQILLIPKDAKVAADGTVTATEDAWNACRREAEELLRSWKNDWRTSRNADASFGSCANEHSADQGSALNGGLYAGVTKGQLISELDEWVFTDGRAPGETAILRSALGIHIVYLTAAHPAGSGAARASAMEASLEALWEEKQASADLTVDYSAAALWCSPSAESITTDRLLYADVGHERFPEAITYLQQDFFYVQYGKDTLGHNGCGITTMAMLATYMTDEIWSPAMLAERYSSYSATNGTDGTMFVNVSPELGFYLDTITGDMDAYIKALQNGQRVIVLEQKGRFTSAGHYLLLQQYYEEDDTFQIRDSNIYNYKRLSGHAVDRFTRAEVLSGLCNGYIMQKKIVRIPACSRCGDTFEEAQPARLLNSDYTCVKCTEALARRNAFLDILAGA